MPMKSLCTTSSKRLALAPIALFCIISSGIAQDTAAEKYGLSCIRSAEAYLASLERDSTKKMCDLHASVPGIVLDLRYASTRNFMHRKMYPSGLGYSFLRCAAASALAQVQSALHPLGYGLKVFDAYRPYAVTVRFWELVHDERYVADPAKGSGHNRGIAVDLTLIELKSGKELPMPTGFDNFTDSAHHDFMELTEGVIRNRKLLRESMEKAGFIAFPTEWWHYSLPDPEKYEVLDLPFADLRKTLLP
jgi:D-alanyl-D-alanine dipeptidase